MSKINIRLNKKFSYWGLVVVLIVMHIAIGLKTVNFGGKLSELESEEKRLKTEIKNLNSQLVGETSITRISGISDNLGFKNPDTTLFVNEREAVAAGLSY